MTKKKTKQKQSKQVSLQIDAQMAEELAKMSKQAGTSSRNLLATLLWMGKKAFGREVTIESDAETQALSIKSFADLPKLESLDD